jgi:3-oxoacyl-[acyl-carrier protein] reductase
VTLSGKVVLVTGASRGIGLAVARAFAQSGCRVILNSATDEDAGELAVREIIDAGGVALYHRANASDPDEVDRLFAAAEGAFGSVEILVNNAGRTEPAAFVLPDGAPPDLKATRDHWLAMLEVNLLSTVLCSQRAAPPMLTLGHGVIINTSSIRGIDANGREGIMAYSAAKAGVHNFTRTLAKQLAPTVRVNAVAPGFVATSYMDRTDDEMKAAWLDAIPLGRFITPDEVAQAYIYLAESPVATGTVLTLDAGFTLGKG